MNNRRKYTPPNGIHDGGKPPYTWPDVRTHGPSRVRLGVRQSLVQLFATPRVYFFFEKPLGRVPISSLWLSVPSTRRVVIGRVPSGNLR